MIGHLGNRVSALLDGQLTARDTEEAWEHVYACHACRDLVEREGWVKTRLAGLCGGERMAPSDLKGSLLSMPPGDALLSASERDHGGRRGAGAVMIGGGAVGAAMLGVLAFGLTSGGVPPADRRPPTTQIDSVVPSAPVTTPSTVAGNGAVTVSTTLSTGLRMPVRGMLP